MANLLQRLEHVANPWYDKMSAFGDRVGCNDQRFAEKIKHGRVIAIGNIAVRLSIRISRIN
jgi:hypothetical protein